MKHNHLSRQTRQKAESESFEKQRYRGRPETEPQTIHATTKHAVAQMEAGSGTPSHEIRRQLALDLLSRRAVAE